MKETCLKCEYQARFSSTKGEVLMVSLSSGGHVMYVT